MEQIKKPPWWGDGVFGRLARLASAAAEGNPFELRCVYVSHVAAYLAGGVAPSKKAQDTSSTSHL